LACMNNSTFSQSGASRRRGHSAPDNLKIFQETTAPRSLSAPPHVSPLFSSATTGVVASAHLENQLAVTIAEGAMVGAKAGLGIPTSKLDSED
jgi:hypothetical protein